MREDITDDLRVFDEADDPHGAFAFRTNQRINLVYFLNQSCPAFPECLHISLRFENGRYGIVVAFLLPFSPRDIAVIAIISDHLFAPVGDMRTHCRQPFQSLEVLAYPAIFCRINDLAFLIQILHPFLRERRPGYVTRQIFHRGFIFR